MALKLLEISEHFFSDLGLNFVLLLDLFSQLAWAVVGLNCVVLILSQCHADISKICIDARNLFSFTSWSAERKKLIFLR